MAQYQITVDSEILHHLFLKDAKDFGMAKLLESVLNQVLEAQVAEHVEQIAMSVQTIDSLTAMEVVQEHCLREWEPLR